MDFFFGSSDTLVDHDVNGRGKKEDRAMIDTNKSMMNEGVALSSERNLTFSLHIINCYQF